MKGYCSFAHGILGTEDVRRYLVSLLASHSASSVNAAYRAIRTFSNWLMAEGFIDGDPIPNVKPPRVPKTQPEPFSDEDMQKLDYITSGHRFVDYRNRALVYVFVDTGLRLAEMSRLRKDDIHMEAGTIKLMGKGGKERRVRIGSKARIALLRYLLLRDDDFEEVWLSENRLPLTRDGMKLAIRQLCMRAGIKGKHGPHRLRHTAAISFLRNGGGEFNLQQMLGHSTLTMTRHYVNAVSDEDVFKAHEKASPADRLFGRAHEKHR